MTDERWGELKGLLDVGGWVRQNDRQEIVAYVEALRAEVADLRPCADLVADRREDASTWIEHGAARERDECVRMLIALLGDIPDSLDRKQSICYVVNAICKRGPLLPPLPPDRMREELDRTRAVVLAAKALHVSIIVEGREWGIWRNLLRDLSAAVEALRDLD